MVRVEEEDFKVLKSITVLNKIRNTKPINNLTRCLAKFLLCFSEFYLLFSISYLISFAIILDATGEQ